ncbi:MAG: transposase [Nitrososphaerales archaeon]
MEFRELSDDEWGLIKPLLSLRARIGRPRIIDDRMIVNESYICACCYYVIDQPNFLYVTLLYKSCKSTIKFTPLIEAKSMLGCST